MFSTLPVLFFLLATVHCGKDKPIFSDEIQEIIDTVHNECVGKTGVPEEDIQNCEKGIFKDDEKLKSYMVCLLEEASLGVCRGMQFSYSYFKTIFYSASDNFFIKVDDGQVDYDMLVSLMPSNLQDRVKAMLYACKHLDTPDKAVGQRAYDVHKCTYEKDPDLYFLL